MEEEWEKEKEKKEEEKENISTGERVRKIVKKIKLKE